MVFRHSIQSTYRKRNKHTDHENSSYGHRKMKSPPGFPPHRNNTFYRAMWISIARWALLNYRPRRFHTSDSLTTRCCSHAMLSQILRLLLTTWNEYLQQVPCTLLPLLLRCITTTSSSVSRIFTIYMFLQMLYQMGKGYAIENLLMLPPQYLH